MPSIHHEDMGSFNVSISDAVFADLSENPIVTESFSSVNSWVANGALHQAAVRILSAIAKLQLLFYDSPVMVIICVLM